MFDINELVQNIIASKRETQIRYTKQMSLGSLISKLESLLYECKDYPVMLQMEGSKDDIEYKEIAELNSWRGAYEELAIGYIDTGKIVNNLTNLKNIVDLLTYAIGKTYYGYKGGEYVMTIYTPLWVANCGETNMVGDGYMGVLDVDVRDKTVFIICGECEYL